MEYRPAYGNHRKTKSSDLDRLSEECARILASKEPDNLDELFSLGGSSGGARPKIMTEVDGKEWIIKFPSSSYPKDIGLMEYEYNACADECGIEVPEFRLFPSKKCKGYFGCRRFDRSEVGSQRKIHMASASALLEVSHRIPSLDYNSLMAITWQLTKKSKELERMYRLMCFNVFAHNRDDHSNNFSFLYDDDGWRLSPAYDLTYSDSVGGEHATTVAGNGRNPGLKELFAVAERAGIKARSAKEIAEEVKIITEKRLSKYLATK